MRSQLCEYHFFAYMHGFSRPCSSKQAILLRKLSKHLGRIVSINFLHPSAYGYLVHATIHLAIDFPTEP